MARRGRQAPHHAMLAHGDHHSITSLFSETTVRGSIVTHFKGEFVPREGAAELLKVLEGLAGTKLKRMLKKRDKMPEMPYSTEDKTLARVFEVLMDGNASSRETLIWLMLEAGQQLGHIEAVA